LGLSRWTGAYVCWGLENREAPLRVIQGSAGAAGANAEVKCVDASGNPYLVVGALLAAGMAGLDAALVLPPECAVDPATLAADERVARGIAPLPADLTAATAALAASTTLRAAMGDMLHDALCAVRRREHEDAAGRSDDELCTHYRFRY
jgi:glutamine synthetase